MLYYPWDRVRTRFRQELCLRDYFTLGIDFMKLFLHWLLAWSLFGSTAGCLRPRYAETPLTLATSNPFLLEIVNVRSDGGNESKVVLTRGDILMALGGELPAKWGSVNIEKARLLTAWMPDRQSKQDRQLAEKRLAASTVSESYTSSELGASNADELLKDLFCEAGLRA